jgi:hypothetical protein
LKHSSATKARKIWTRIPALLGVLALLVQAFVPLCHIHRVDLAAGELGSAISTVAPHSDDTSGAHHEGPALCPACQSIHLAGAFTLPLASGVAAPAAAAAEATAPASAPSGRCNVSGTVQPRGPPLLT